MVTEVLPTATDAEGYVMGVLIARPESAANIFSRLKSTDFVNKAYAAIFARAAKLHAEGGFDPTVVASELKGHPEFGEVSAAALMLELGQSAGSPVVVPRECQKIIAARRKRQIAEIGEHARASALNGHSPESILATLRCDLEDLERESTSAPKLVAFSDITPMRVNWAWNGWLPRGMLTLLDGDPEKGKSQITCAIAACWTTNKPFPGAELDPMRTLGRVLFVATEDNHDCVQRPRLDAAGADPKRVFAWPEDAEPLVLPQGIDMLRAAVVENGIDLVILDPITAHLGEDINANRDADVRRALRPLVQLAQELDITVLGVRHLNKDSGKAALYRGGGSVGFVAAARCVWAVGLDPNDASRHVLAVLKSNIGQKPPSLFYRIERWESTSRIHWQGESTYTASDIIVTQKHRAPEKQSKAESIIAELLFDGPKPEREVWAACEAKGIGSWSYKQARRILNVQSSKRGLSDGWILSLPEEVGEHEEVGEDF